MIRVLIVEDSPVVRELLEHVLTADPDIAVIGSAESGEAALHLLESTRPDLITMDINLPGMDGFEATRSIMERFPTPIVVVSGTIDPLEVHTTFRAMQAGALAVTARPAGLDDPRHETQARKLRETVRLLSEVKVVRRWRRKRIGTPQAYEDPGHDARRAGPDLHHPPIAHPKARFVAVGASTGGPAVCLEILSALPPDFPAPIAIVQHMAPGFLEGFTEWLSQSSGFPVELANDGELLLPGHAYVAPDRKHLGIGEDGRAILDGGPPENGMRPSVSHLFRTVARAFGSEAIGVLLTGMGRDGARELGLLRDAGATTIAQDETTSVVYGMPGAAAALGAASHILPPDRIAALLTASVVLHTRT